MKSAAFFMRFQMFDSIPHPFVNKPRVNDHRTAGGPASTATAVNSGSAKCPSVAAGTGCQAPVFGNPFNLMISAIVRGWYLLYKQ